MDRAYYSGAILTPPTPPASPSMGYPTAGSPGVTPPTVPGAWWYHMITEELRKVITDAGLVPDHEDLTQLSSAIQTMIGLHVLPVGSIIVGTSTNPPAGWLRCNGAAVSRTTYADLFAAIGTTFGAGNGTTTFNLPDLRGEFIRGWDDGRGVDAGRVFGSAQGDAIRNLLGSFNGPTGDGGGATLAGDGNLFTASRVGNAGSNTVYATISSHPLSRITLDASRVVPTANEVRPRNVALPFYIRY